MERKIISTATTFNSSYTQNNQLYCHFYHLTGVCKKGDKCTFKHGKKLNGCPNGERCPIQVLHMEIENNNFNQKGESSNTAKQSTSVKSTSNQKDIQPEEKKVDQKIGESTKNLLKELDDEEAQEQSSLHHKKSKLPPKPVVIKDDLPDNIRTLIQSNYNESQESANFIQNFYLIHQDMKLFLPIYHDLFPKMELDLMFIMDCTGSMSQWLHAVKNEIRNIVDTIRRQNSVNMTIRLSFVGYRDYGTSNRFSIFDFSDDLGAFNKFLKELRTEGNLDLTEDVAGGFKHANLQEWVSKAKYAVLLADYPGHGRQFSNDHDRFPDGDPDGVDLKEEFKKLIRKGVNLYIVEILPNTEMMFGLFKQYNKEETGNDLTILKLGSSTNGFGQVISQTATQTVSMSYTKGAKEDPQGAYYKALKICQAQNSVISENFLKRFNFRDDHESDESDELIKKSEFKEVSFQVSPAKEFPFALFSQNIDAICHSYFIVQDVGVPINWRKPLVQHCQLKTKIQISRVPFAEGAMRYAFFAKDTLLQQKLVAKLNKKQHKTNPELIKEDMVKDLETQFICQHIVNQYNDRVSEHVESSENLKNFVHCFIYEFTDSQHPFKYYSAENYIAGDYVKFNNNSGWCDFKQDEPGQLSQALSHFSYQATEGYLMIVDLQGVGNLLTDPQIHCLDQHRFGSGNLGYSGMFKFFMSHHCNQFCRHLNLIHPQVKEIPQDMKFFKYEIEKPFNPQQKVFTMCDVCKKAFKIGAGFLYERRIQCREKYCPACNSMRVATLKTDSCKSCKGPFTYSTYWTLMKRTQASELCIECRKQERDRLRSKLEKE